MNVLSKEYQQHQVFSELKNYHDFYEGLSFTVIGFLTTGTKSAYNIDTYVFSSMKGTVNSITTILKNGRINDAWALLRKYYDSTIINIYSNIFLEDHVSLYNFIVEQIDNWLSGKVQLPEYRIMSAYIRNSVPLQPINDLLYKDDTYKKIRSRCNDNTHYNFYHNVLLNDNEIHLSYRIKALDRFAVDIRNIFILHFAYLFFLKQHYMSSTDYIDYLDCGLTPAEGSQYWVAGFVQDAFDNTIKKFRSDIAEVILKNTCMQLK